MFVARLCLILLYSVIFVLRSFPHKHRVCAVLSFGSPYKVSYTLLLRFSQNFVLRFLPQKHRVCAVLLPRLPSSLLHACVYFALFGNFLLCVFCPLPPRPQHRACAVLFPSPPLKFTPFWFSLFYSVCFCYACFAQQAPVCAVIFPRLPSNLHALFFALYYLVSSLCSAFFPSLI